MTEDGDGTASTGASPMSESGTFTHRRHDSRIKGFEQEQQQQQEEEDVGKRDEEFVARLRWPDFTAQVFVHLGCLYGFYLVLVSAKIYTTLFGKYNWKCYSILWLFLQNIL